MAFRDNLTLSQSIASVGTVFIQAADPTTDAESGDIWIDSDDDTTYVRNYANDGWVTVS